MNSIHAPTKENYVCDRLHKGDPIRHLGIRVSELCRNDFRQLSLFERDYEKQRVVDRTVLFSDNIVYGRNI